LIFESDKGNNEEKSVEQWPDWIPEEGLNVLFYLYRQMTKGPEENRLNLDEIRDEVNNALCHL